MIRRTGVVGTLAIACLGCPQQPTEPATPQVEAAPRMRPRPVRPFVYSAFDGTRVTNASLRGRMTVVALIASYDTASQAQARYLKGLMRKHAPRLNIFMLVLEPPHHEPLARAFASTLELPFPVAMADAATIAGKGPFDRLHHVPSVVVLDRDGREVWRHLGLIDENKLSREIARRDPQQRR